MWINEATGKVYAMHYEIRRDFPTMSMPVSLTDTVLLSIGVHPVKPAAQPTYDPTTERVERGQPVRQQRRNEDGTFVADDPETPDDEAWEWVQTWNVVPLTPDEIAAAEQAAREAAKAERERQVAEIKVTTSTGKTFDGDETSQTRMARAIIALEKMGAPSVTWVLADNTETQATVAELAEALALAGAAQAALWVIE